MAKGLVFIKSNLSLRKRGKLHYRFSYEDLPWPKPYIFFHFHVNIYGFNGEDLGSWNNLHTNYWDALVGFVCEVPGCFKLNYELPYSCRGGSRCQDCCWNCMHDFSARSRESVGSNLGHQFKILLGATKECSVQSDVPATTTAEA